MPKYDFTVDGVSVEAVFNKLGGAEGAKRFLSGKTKLICREPVIDFDAIPFADISWEIAFHQKTLTGIVALTRNKDTVYVGGRRIEFVPLTNQGDGRFTTYSDFRKELKRRQDLLVLDANVLEGLLKFPDLIPESWKFDEKGRTRLIFFLDTIFSDYDSRRVLYLCWNGERWRWCRVRLERGYELGALNTDTHSVCAAVLAS